MSEVRHCPVCPRVIKNWQVVCSRHWTALGQRAQNEVKARRHCGEDVTEFVVERLNVTAESAWQRAMSICCTVDGKEQGTGRNEENGASWNDSSPGSSLGRQVDD